MDEKSPWLWGVLYHNAEDERLWVPKRAGLGWTVNLAHPKAATALLKLMAAAVLLPLLGCAAWRWRLLAAAPATAAWFIISLGLAFAAYGLNRTAWMSCKGMLTGLVFGTLAAATGFGLQFVFNAPVAFWIGMAHATWKHHLYFAAVAAICQTLGKLLVLVAWLRMQAGPDAREGSRRGLLVGLGFTVLEIALIWFSMLVSGIPVAGLAGAWERGIASVFHIYSGGLLAIFLRSRRRAWLGAVVAVHFLMDWLAGANATLLHWPMYGLELAFATAAALVWMLFLFVERRAT